MLLLSYWHNAVMIERSIFIVNSSNCNPTVFYNIDGKVYTVCINSYHLCVAVYEVQLNLSGSVTKLEREEFVEPLVTSINLSSSQPLTDCQSAPVQVKSPAYNTRQVTDFTLENIRANTSQFLYSFFPHSISLWNSQSTNTQTALSFYTFKQLL